MLSLVRHSSYKFSFILSVIAYLTEAWWSDTPLVLYNEKNSSSPKYFHYFWRNYSDRRINQYNEDEVQIWFLFLTSMNAQKNGKNEKLSIYSFICQFTASLCLLENLKFEKSLLDLKTWRDVFKLVVKRIWVFTTSSAFIIHKPLQTDDISLWYFKLRLLGLTWFIVWNIKGLRHWVAKILGSENQSFLAKTQLLKFWLR